jgi:hypothetical protein
MSVFVGGRQHGSVVTLRCGEVMRKREHCRKTRRKVGVIWASIGLGLDSADFDPQIWAGSTMVGHGKRQLEAEVVNVLISD